MPDLYAAVPGGMPTGWLKKIGLLEKQMVEAQREIVLLKRKMQTLEERAAVENVTDYVNGQLLAANKAANDHMTAQMEAAIGIPIKRGPGRPRKNPL